MSATAYGAADIPQEGFFRRAQRKAKRLAEKAKVAGLSALAWTTDHIKRTAKKAGRVSLGALFRTVGALGWLITGAVKLVVGLVNFIVTNLAILITAALSLVVGLFVALAMGILMIFAGARYGVNYLWDGSNWLVRGRPTSWKLYRLGQRAGRAIGDVVREEKIRRMFAKLGVDTKPDADDELDDLIAAYDDVEGPNYEGPVRLLAYDAAEPEILIEERFFPNRAAAVDFITDHLAEQNLTIEVESIDDLIDESVEEVTVETIARHALGDEVRDVHVEEMRDLVDEDQSVPTEEQVLANLAEDSYSTATAPSYGEWLDLEIVPTLADPREYDWHQHFLRPEVNVAYKYLKDRALSARDLSEASYWDARLWMRTQSLEHDPDLRTSPQKAMALYTSQVDRRRTNLNQARNGIVAECANLQLISQRLLSMLDELDEAEAAQANQFLGQS